MPLQFFDFFDHLWQEVKDIGLDANVSHLENGRLGIPVDGNDKGVSLESGEVLERAADTTGHINLWFHGLS
jgi:hypothetical protein